MGSTTIGLQRAHRPGSHADLHGHSYRRTDGSFGQVRDGLQALVGPGETVAAAVVLSNGYIKHQKLHVLGVTERSLLIAPVKHALRWRVLEPIERLERAPIDPLPIAKGTGFQSLVVGGRQFYVDPVGCSEAATLNAAITG